MECRICHEEKELTEFKKKSGGYDTICKVCYAPLNREYNRQYHKTFKGWIRVSWSRMNIRAGNRGNKYPTYTHVKVLMTREEFVAWAQPQEPIWRGIKESNDSPTIDRIDPDGHYEISNIQILSLRENSSRNTGRHLRTPEALVRHIVAMAKKLNISLSTVAELIIKEQVDCSTK
jgi:hypothetical protein